MFAGLVVGELVRVLLFIVLGVCFFYFVVVVFLVCFLKSRHVPRYLHLNAVDALAV